MRFIKSQLEAYCKGDLYRCFGEAVSYTRCFIRAPHIPALFSSIKIEGNRIEAEIEACIFDSLQAIRSLLAFYFISENLGSLSDGHEFFGCDRLNIQRISGPYKIIIENLKCSKDEVCGEVFYDLNGAPVSLGPLKVLYRPNWIYRSLRKPESYNQEAMIHAALGKPSFGSGEGVSDFDTCEGIVPRLPSHEVSCISAIEKVEGKSCTSVYKIPDFAFKETGHLPFYLLLEAGLQPCGWLAFHTGCYKSLETEVCIRNLDGVIEQFLPIDESMKEIKFDVRLLSVIPLKAAQTVLMKFKIAGFCGDKHICDIQTSFGYFDKKGLQKSNKLDVAADVLAFQKQLKPKLLPGDDAYPMVDEILHMDAQMLHGRRFISPDDWYFKAHFFGDPVQPGSIGIQCLLDLYCIYAKSKGIKTPHAWSKISWKYRGQVLSTHSKVDVILSMKNGITGYIFADDEPIYIVELTL